MRSNWRVVVRDSEDNTKYDTGKFIPNLTTDTASGYTNRRDWQSKLMGGGQAASASFSGAATATSATSLTNSGATFPTAGQALAGMIVAAGPNSSGAGSTAWAVVVSNTATVLTVDRWYSAAAPGGAAATTPNATATYQILPGQAPAWWMALTENATAAAATDTFLTGELTTDGFSRAIATYSHTAAATTYSLNYLYTATGTRTINKMALFNAGFKTLNTADGGAMPFESAMPNPPTLVSGDTLSVTSTITIN